MAFQTLDYTQKGTSNWLESILINAIVNRASDIHFEPEKEKFMVRFRVDGVLYLLQNFQKEVQENILSRVKVIAHLDIAEHRIPQDGHFEFAYKDKIYDFRISTAPTIYGEAMVIRIFNRDDALIKLENLGMEPDQLTQIKSLITSPSGIILITGPTGSGKTTLLYSFINYLNKPERNIITIEDPVEYQIGGIRQININESIGLTFAKVLRAMFRQDPDIVMLGEIRDPDSAQMAMQAALTGHLIFSTFHTFNVPSLVVRFLELGITRSIIAESIKGVVSTRLLRKVCPNCREEYAPTEMEKKFLDQSFAGVKFIRGRGCDKCMKGYYGRVGIYEIVPFDEEIKMDIIEKETISNMLNLMKNKRMKDLRQRAIEKIISGETTVEEAIRVIGFPS